MKYCKKCNVRYSQNGVNFCRNDGLQLIEDEPDLTETIPLPDINQSKDQSIWIKLLNYDLDLYDKGISSPVTIAGEYVQIGDKDKAIEWLEEAYSHHSKELPYLSNNPSLSDLRSDPRFKDLLLRIESSSSKNPNQ
jgi:hypothetical protein